MKLKLMFRSALSTALLLAITGCGVLDVFNSKDDDNNDDNYSDNSYYTTIDGRVVDSVSGLAVTNAEVKLSNSYNTFTNTDGDGYFSLNAQNYGSFCLEISKTGYTSVVTDTQYTHVKNGFYNYKDIKITPISINTYLSGYVYDTYGNKISDATLNITSKNGILNIISDSNGYYSTSVDHYGTIVVQASKTPENDGVKATFYLPYQETITTKNTSYTHDITITSNSL